MYGLCKDPNNNNMMMTSCYSLNPGLVFQYKSIFKRVCLGVATSSITAVFGTYDNLGGNQDDYTYASVRILTFWVSLAGTLCYAFDEEDDNRKQHLKARIC